MHAVQYYWESAAHACIGDHRVIRAMSFCGTIGENMFVVVVYIHVVSNSGTVRGSKANSSRFAYQLGFQSRLAFRTPAARRQASGFGNSRSSDSLRAKDGAVKSVIH